MHQFAGVCRRIINLSLNANRNQYCRTLPNLVVTRNNSTSSISNWIRKFRNMDKVKELEAEREKLEARVQTLVHKLEELKKPAEIKINRDLVIKPKEFHDANQAMEQLSLKAETDKPKESKPAKAKSEPKPKQPKQKGSKEPPAPEKPLDVSRLDLRIGRILEVSRHPDADALYVEKIDCGDPTGPRTVISGLVKHVPIEEMKDRNVVVLCNLKPAKMRGILSEAMVMCASTEEKVELLQPPENVKPGDKVVFANYPGECDDQLNPKKKIWEQVAPDIKTNSEGVAVYKECEFQVINSVGKFTSNLKNVQIK